MMLDLDRFHSDGMTIADLAHIARVDFSTAWRWVARGARPSSADARQRLKRRGLWRETAPAPVVGDA